MCVRHIRRNWKEEKEYRYRRRNKLGELGRKGPRSSDEEGGKKKGLFVGSKRPPPFLGGFGGGLQDRAKTEQKRMARREEKRTESISFPTFGHSFFSSLFVACGGGFVSFQNFFCWFAVFLTLAVLLSLEGALVVAGREEMFGKCA